MSGLGIALLSVMVAGLWRTLKGPTRADRLVAAQLIGSTAVALLLVMAQQHALPSLRDVALVLALLAAIISAALVQLLRNRPDE